MKTWKTKSGYQVMQVLCGRSNVFLLTNGIKNILIDTSVSRSWIKLQQQLETLGANTIDCLILTHAHFDHAANAKQIKKKFNPVVFIQRAEGSYLSEGENILPDGTIGLTRLLVKLLGKGLFRKLRYDPCKPDILIDSEYNLNSIGFKAYLLHTPGHTAGSMSLIVDDEIAIVGDAMFGVFKWSVFPPFAEDKDLMIKSWGKLLDTKCKEFLPSHGTPNSRSAVQKEYIKRTRTILRTR